MTEIYPTMKNKLCSSLISTAICLLATIYSVQSQCCDFDTTTCSWSPSAWKTAPTDEPNLENYTEFDSTKPSDDYIFIQDASGTISSITTFHIASQGVTISLDYFMDSYEPNAQNNKLQVYFQTNDTLSLAYVMVENGSWQTLQVQCTSANDYCCYDGILPCDGTIKISAVVDSTYPIGLFAVDNIGIGCGTVTSTSTASTTTTTPTTTTSTATTPTTTTSTTTTPTTTTSTTTSPTTRPTLPPPIPPVKHCCYYETDACGATSPNNDWYLSLALVPTLAMPVHDGQYIWTDQAYSELILWDLTDVSSITTFIMDYYISGPGVTLSIQFLDSDTGSCEISQLTQHENNWARTPFLIDTCCTTGFCNGQIVLEVLNTSDTFVIAVDNTQVNDECYDSLPCCHFADVNACGFLSEGTILWQWSRTAIPVSSFPIPPDGDFEYFEFTDVTTPAIEMGLISQPVTVWENTTFTLTFYADTPTTSSGSFMVWRFINTDADIVTTLDYYKITAGNWITASATCGGEHGSCCQDKSYCNGNIEFVAQVGENEGPVQYGIDTLQIGNLCETMQ